MILNEQQIKELLLKFPAWNLRDGGLVKAVTLKDFSAAMDYVNAVAKIAEVQGHHPDISISYNQVALKTSTHDAGGITEKDAALIEAIEKIES